MAKQTFTTGQVLTAAQQNSLQSNDFNQTVSVKTANYSLLAADKGTRIEFNTSGSVTCTVNSGQFDAGDTLIIQNRGAGTATITAGTATVNTSASLALTQYSAGTLYFVSDSAALFFGDAAGISASLIDAKGDLIVGTADNTVGRLAVGTNGYTLVADSVEATGLKWVAPAAAGFVGASVSNSGSQSIANTTETIMTFDTEQFDTDAFHSTASNTGRMTVPTGKGGKYLLSGMFNCGTNAVNMEFYLYVNGSYYITGFPQTQSLQNSRGTALAILNVVVSLSAGDYVEVKAYQESGGAINVRNQYGRYQISYLGA